MDVQRAGLALRFLHQVSFHALLCASPDGSLPSLRRDAFPVPSFCAIVSASPVEFSIGKEGPISCSIIRVVVFADSNGSLQTPTGIQTVFPISGNQPVSCCAARERTGGEACLRGRISMEVSVAVPTAWQGADPAMLSSRVKKTSESAPISPVSNIVPSNLSELFPIGVLDMMTCASPLLLLEELLRAVQNYASLPPPIKSLLINDRTS